MLVLIRLLFTLEAAGSNIFVVLVDVLVVVVVVIVVVVIVVVVIIVVVAQAGRDVMT